MNKTEKYLKYLFLKHILKTGFPTTGNFYHIQISGKVYDENKIREDMIKLRAQLLSEYEVED